MQDQNQINYDLRQLLSTRVEAYVQWIETTPSDSPGSLESQNVPDLLTFYKELCALRQSSQVGFRRANESLAALLDTVSSQCSLDSSATSEPVLDERGTVLALVELLNRLMRMSDKLKKPSRKKWWQPAQLKSEGIDQGIDIVVSHFEEILGRLRVSRIATRNAPFAPDRMMAVGIESRSDVQDGLVAHESAPGYLWRGEVLKPAEVIVFRNKSGV